LKWLLAIQGGCRVIVAQVRATPISIHRVAAPVLCRLLGMAIDLAGVSAWLRVTMIVAGLTAVIGRRLGNTLVLEPASFASHAP
jgi:hypothetical protein